jgi:hypothetical protein
MKKIITAIAGLATAGAALAQVDTTRLMIIGVGNANAKPGAVIVTNQTAPANATSTDTSTTTLEKFVVTGSLLGHDKKGQKPSRLEATKASGPEGPAAPAGAAKTPAAARPTPVVP